MNAYYRRMNAFLEKAAEKVEEEARKLDGRERSIKMWKAVEIRSLKKPLFL